MNLFLVGVSHRTAPLELRERLFIPRAGLSAMLDDLKRVQGVQEGLILSTCNRTELVTTLHDPIAGPGSLIDFLSVHQGLRAADIERHLYRLHDLQAVRHVFRVASSLDSLVVGEPQILGQVKDAYQASVERRMLGRVLDGLMRHSFEVARKVRTRTGIARHPVSVGQAAVGLARQIFGTLAGRTVMLIGAGKMSELAARQLVTEGVREVIVANRTHERALDMARRVSGTAVAFESLGRHFEAADIVITSTGAPHFVVSLEQAVEFMRPRRSRPLFFIDIAVPRDVDPRVNDIDNVYLYDIDDLERVVDANRAERLREAALAETLVEEEVVTFDAWRRGLDAGPAIVALRERCHRLKDEELEHFLSRHRDLSEAARGDLAALLNGLVNRILHEPSVRLKKALARDDGALRAEIFRDLFGLTEPPPEPPRRRGGAGGSETD